MKKRKKAAGITAVCIFAAAIIFIRFAAVPLFVYPMRYGEYVEEYSKKYNLKSELIYAVIKTESGFKESAVSSKEAIGLMQIMESTADWIISKSDIEAERGEYSEPDINIEMGCWYLRYLLDYFDNHPNVQKVFKTGFCPDEFWVQTILYNSSFKERMVQDVHRHMIWERRFNSYPAILNEGDFNEINDGDYHFCRKTIPGISDKLIEMLNSANENQM